MAQIKGYSENDASKASALREATVSTNSVNTNKAFLDVSTGVSQEREEITVSSNTGTATTGSVHGVIKTVSIKAPNSSASYNFEIVDEDGAPIMKDRSRDGHNSITGFDIPVDNEALTINITSATDGDYIVKIKYTGS